MKNIISKIVGKYLSSRHSSETEEKVQKWLIKDENAEEKESASLDFWDSLEIAPDSKAYSALDKVNHRIGYPSEQQVSIPLYKKLSRIAAVLIPLFIIAGGYLYYQSTRSNLIEIQVAYGEEKHLFLPDSSEIWINAGSTVKYPKEFKGDKRTVQLDGEAYFSVKKDASKPFIVNTEMLSVAVLGTKFNVKAYTNDEKITTTLTSGKVEVKSEAQSRILRPNEQLSFDKKTSAINISEIPSNETDAWKSGQLIFTDASLSDVLQTLERHFNITIENNTGISTSKLYTVKFLKNESLDEILNIMQDVASFSYWEKDGKIMITKK
ncbi:MAG: FecR family protein [Dysgonomonas sp.]